MDLQLLTNEIAALEQRIDEHLRRDRDKDAQIAALVEDKAKLQAQLAATQDPNRDALFASLVQRLATASNRL